MKQIMFVLIVLLFYGNDCFSQQDKIHKHHVSSNLAAGLLSGELGIYYDYSISKSYKLHISYGHRFWQFNIIENGGGGSEYKYLAQKADIFRVGIKRHFVAQERDEFNSNYLVYQISYWQMQTPIYINREGSNGLNAIRRNIISVQKKLINLSMGYGRMVYHNKHIFSDIFIKFGIAPGYKYTHLYSSGFGGNADDLIYPPNTIKRTVTILPTIDLGFTIGYCWY